MKPLFSFDTDRLLINPTTLEDAALILELLNTPKWLQYIGDRNVHSIDDAEKYIQNRIISQFDRLGFGNYTLVRKSDQKSIGSCGLYDREGVDGIDIGFALLPEYEGEGFAYEAASRLLRAAFEIFQLPKVSAITRADNLNSQKLLRKLGLTFSEKIHLGEGGDELMLYQLLRYSK